MKHNNQHIIKKSYAKPVIEEVMLDREISIAMTTPPPGEPPGGGIEDPPAETAPPAPKYSTEYRSESPFGGAGPTY